MSNQRRSGGKGGTWESGSQSRSGNKSGNQSKRKSPQNEKRNSQDKARQISSPESREASGTQTPTLDNSLGNGSKSSQELQPSIPKGTSPKARPFSINKSSNEEKEIDQKLSPKDSIRERIKVHVSNLEKVDPDTSGSEKLSNSYVEPQPVIVKTESGPWRCDSEPNDQNESRQSSSNTDENWDPTEEDKAENSVAQSFITEIEGNLFSAPDDVSLAHCVGADLRMGSGIAVKFYERFKSVGKLMDQRVEPGGVAYICSGRRHVFYMITKRASTDKPTLNTLRQSLLALREKCKTLNVSKLAMPRIACGLDELSWENVKQMLEEIFANDFVITIYNLDRGFTDKPKDKSMVKNEDLLLKDIEPETGLLYIGCAKRYDSEEMKSLNEKHCFLPLIKKSTFRLGTAFQTRLGQEAIYGLICKQSANSPLSYENLEAAIVHLNENNRKRGFGWYGIQAFQEKDDPYVMEKIGTLFRNSSINAEFWICWPPSLVDTRPSSSKQNDEAMQHQESSPTGDHRSSSSRPSDFSKQSKNWRNNDYSPKVKSKWESTQRNRQSQDHGVSEVEKKMKTQSLADESKPETSIFNCDRSEPAIDASNTTEMEWSDDSLLANISEPVDSANTAEDEGWPDESNWLTHAEDEKRKSFEKKEAVRQNKEKEKQERRSGSGKTKCVTECKGDLFDAEDTMCLAHCVGADFRMGSGIAVLFRQKFGSVGELLDQKVRQGGVAVLRENSRWIFYLVTKRESTGKPTYDTLRSSLHELHKKCKELNVTELAMPRIGCGLDRLDWDSVKAMIEDIFADGFFIKIYNLEKEYKETKQSMPKTTIKREALYLKDIEVGTGLLYIASEEPTITEEMKSLDDKYRFIQRLDKTKPKLGTVVYTEASYPREIVYGLVCRKSPNDPLSFVHLKAALKQLRKMNDGGQYRSYGYFGIQAFEERGDDCIMGKIETMLRYSYIKAEAWICFPPSLKHLMSESSSPSYSEHTSGGRRSWDEPDNRRMFIMLRDMQRMQESTYRKLLTQDDMGKEIHGPEGLKEKEKQTTAQMIKIGERMDEISSKIDEVIQHLHSFDKSREEDEQRFSTLEMNYQNLGEKVEFLEQQLLMPQSSAGPSFNVNGSYPYPGFPDGPPLLQGPTGQQVCNSPPHYYRGRIHVVPPAYPNNRHIFASEQLPEEKEALIRAAKKFARMHKYQITTFENGFIQMRKDNSYQWTPVHSHGDLTIL